MGLHSRWIADPPALREAASTRFSPGDIAGETNTAPSLAKVRALASMATIRSSGSRCEIRTGINRRLSSRFAFPNPAHVGTGPQHSDSSSPTAQRAAGEPGVGTGHRGGSLGCAIGPGTPHLALALRFSMAADGLSSTYRLALATSCGVRFSSQSNPGFQIETPGTSPSCRLAAEVVAALNAPM